MATYISILGEQSFVNPICELLLGYKMIVDTVNFRRSGASRRYGDRAVHVWVASKKFSNDSALADASRTRYHENHGRFPSSTVWTARASCPSPGSVPKSAGAGSATTMFGFNPFFCIVFLFGV